MISFHGFQGEVYTRRKWMGVCNGTYWPAWLTAEEGRRARDSRAHEALARSEVKREFRRVRRLTGSFRQGDCFRVCGFMVVKPDYPFSRLFDK